MHTGFEGAEMCIKDRLQEQEAGKVLGKGDRSQVQFLVQGQESGIVHSTSLQESGTVPSTGTGSR